MSGECSSYHALLVPSELDKDSLLKAGFLLLSENSELLLIDMTDRADLALLIKDSGDRTLGNSGARVGRQAAIVEAQHSMPAHIRLSSLIPMMVRVCRWSFD